MYRQRNAYNLLFILEDAGAGCDEALEYSSVARCIQLALRLTRCLKYSAGCKALKYSSVARRSLEYSSVARLARR
ncbi:hypothetical protein CBR_g22896 [Chara braunii]|uniref:Uncharacterized protein n=1 Tax=Chara braunii TaxID=69332 RepID=A0A388L2Z6_CHABU|nr:hypothetical protein CBR_g22896 [Chara braunii]|eukprot:GBG76679.1 hypothetical protein CBR_g22896 [Chara braunii]